MFENITLIDLKILSLYTKDYKSSFSIRQITQKLNINYAHTFKRVKNLVKEKILLQKKEGQANYISLNIQNIDAIQIMCFVEERESRRIKNTTLRLLIKEMIKIDTLACIGLFGSRVSGKATKDSDWDVFIITQGIKKEKMEKIMSKFPHITNIELQVFSLEEFQESLLVPEETVVKHIIRNKQIIYNPHPFYNIITILEDIKYAPSQTS
ncbi:MAG: nucleotidyltransferase domain-containing protein [Nanoarchaeota archaeon]|nr:nucleotidyltransferase domain-containing protein [Nanoarchaeota archaeon]